MIVPLLFLLPLTCPAAPLAAWPESTTRMVQDEEPTALDRGALEAEIDRSLRWLRGRQDPESGGYGDVLATARVLVTMARSHRAYRVSDGPFVARAVAYLEARRRADGAIADATADGAAAWLQTWWASRALVEVDARADETLAAAQRFLDARRDVAAPTEPPLGLDDPRLGADARRARLGLLAARIVAAREDGAAWGGERGQVLETCAALTRLTLLRNALKALEPAAQARDAQPLPALDAAALHEARAEATRALVRGREFLLATAEAPGRWGFGGRPDPGITAMVAGALLAAPPSSERDTALEAALDWLVSLQHGDGSIHAGQLANYVTSASLMALARADREQDADVIARARDYLRVLQSDEGEGYESSDRFYGGVGYGGDERPDLSNLQMALEALNASGLPADDATFQRALTFLQRCQNRTESNDFTVEVDGTTIVSGNDGGAGYAPGDSKAGFIELRDGRRVPRSYGSMTYALLKGYLFAGLPRDDPRVEAAWEWLANNYTLDVNPGFEASADPTAAYQGLFYYFATMAKALDLYGAETIADAAGREHAWRSELAGRLASMQRQDGSWINANAPRWYEGNPVLATSYAMVALATALGD